MSTYIFTTDDKNEYLNAIHGEDFLICLWRLDEWLRQKVKYNPDNETEDARDAYDKVRKEVRTIMETLNVSLEMLE